MLLKAGVAINIDGKGAWRDDVFAERLWRSVRSEEVHLSAYDSVGRARASIGRYLTIYSGRWLPSGFDRKASEQAYVDGLRQFIEG